jgi:hypothetical protein
MTTQNITVPITGVTATDLLAISNAVSALSTGTVTTSTPPPPPPPVLSSVVYQNGAINWTFNMSYGATVNYQDTVGAPLTGTHDAAITVTGATGGGWQPGVSDACQNQGIGCFGTTPYAYFVFSYKATTANLEANLIMAWHQPGDVPNGNQGVAIGQYCSKPAVGSWGTAKVPLSIFALANKTVSKFTLQSNTPTVFYVNDVGFSAT